MKTQKSFLAFSLLAAMAMCVISSGCHKADTEKVGGDLKTTAQDTASAAKDAYNDGKQKAVEIATNATVIAKEGVQKASAVATNFVAAVKSVTTNVVDKVDQMVH